MKKISCLFMCIVSIVFVSLQANAAGGTIRVKLPEDAENMVVSYKKVAERNEEKLIDGAAIYEGKVYALQGEALLENLEEGIYQIQVSGNETFEFSPSIVSIPSWDESEQKMSYDALIIPKYQKIVEPPQTGDSNHAELYIGIMVILAIIVIITSCHNRFTCGRMSE